MSDEELSGDAAPARRRLTPIDIQQQVFRRAVFRGYNEQDVDDFLDEITEELAFLLEDQRRLREELQDGVTGPASGGQDVAEAKRMAEELVTKARDEAAELVRTARAEAAEMAAAAKDSSALSPFLAQERVFLQDMAKRIGAHAETMRELARARRQTISDAAESRRDEDEQGGAEEPPAEPEPPAEAQSADAESEGEPAAESEGASQEEASHGWYTPKGSSLRGKRKHSGKREPAGSAPGQSGGELFFEDS